MVKFVVIGSDIRGPDGVPAGKEIVLEVIQTSDVSRAERYIMEKYDPEGAEDLFTTEHVTLYTDCIVSTNYGEGMTIPDPYMNEGVVERDSKVYRITIVRIPDDEKNLNASMVGGRRRKTHRRRHSHRRRSHRK